ncbi:MAG: hypothetical protein ABJA71_05270 [Ginsengibacter sp.]
MKKYIQYAALVFMIMGLIGIISETGPVWARFTLLSLGILIFAITFSTKPKG